jgi:cytochrome c2
MEFLAAPQKTKPGTMMPALFEGLTTEEKTTQIEAVTHYLMSLKPVKKQPKSKVARHSNAERGSALFHSVGCVACHEPTKDFHPAAGAPKPTDFANRSVPLPDLKSKYTLLTLTAFLQHPELTRPDGRMPHLGLNEEDAIDIACHLIDYRNSDPREAALLPQFKLNAAKVSLGAEIVAKMNCASCHNMGQEPTPSLSLPIQRVDAGCMTGTPALGRPLYELTEMQRQSLTAFIAAKAAPPLTPVQKTQLTLQALNCYACHERDGVGGPDIARNRYFAGDEALGDSGRLPPPLTGIGKKLRSDWMESVFRGEGRIRPYVKTQMPHYPAQAKTLTALLNQVDEKELPKMAEGNSKAGQKLIGTLGGMNCITCHAWADRQSLGIPALDISVSAKRLTPEWFRDYLLSPQGYRPGTLMPPLWPGGQSMLKDVLGGDTEQQIAAIWAFIKNGEGLPEGYPTHVANAFELIPQDRPIIQRAFIKKVGSCAILAGFPGGIHIAYDGNLGRPALAWRGRFFDAYSTWFVRAAPFEDPLEKEVFAWPKGTGQESAGYRGYRLDSTGAPTFLTTLGDVKVEEHFQVKEGQLYRTVSWDTDRTEPLWTHPAGLQMTEAKSAKNQQRTFIYSWK